MSLGTWEQTHRLQTEYKYHPVQSKVRHLKCLEAQTKPTKSPTQLSPKGQPDAGLNVKNLSSKHYFKFLR